MNYYFILNPASGHSKARKRFLSQLETLGTEYQLIQTSKKGDGFTYARDICEKHALSSEDVRIFACGGDGTVSEVVNGCIGYEHVEVGLIPLGTGNDFARNFGNLEGYFDLNTYVNALSTPCDTIFYEVQHGSEVSKGHCINMFNIGLDCMIAYGAGTIKQLPLIYGPTAYMISVFVNMVHKTGTDLRIKYEDGSVYDDSLLLISIGNGCYCGGGIKGLPLARTDDGLMDMGMVRNVTRRDFVRLFPSYAKGTHLENELIAHKNIIKYDQGRALEVHANEGEVMLCIDGEFSMQQKMKFSIAPGTFRFISPQRRE